MTERKRIKTGRINFVLNFANIIVSIGECVQKNVQQKVQQVLPLHFLMFLAKRCFFVFFFSFVAPNHVKKVRKETISEQYSREQ